MENQENITGTGAVPNPLFFDRPRIVMFEETDLKHREIGIHFSAVYVIRVADRVVVTVSGGPSLLRLRQDLVSNIELGPETDVPFFDTVSVASVATTSANERGLGGHIGFDGTFLLNEQLGVSAFARYVGGSVDLHNGDSVVSVDVGGFQFGGGLRLFF